MDGSPVVSKEMEAYLLKRLRASGRFRDFATAALKICGIKFSLIGCTEPSWPLCEPVPCSCAVEPLTCVGCREIQHRLKAAKLRWKRPAQDVVIIPFFSLSKLTIAVKISGHRDPKAVRALASPLIGNLCLTANSFLQHQLRFEPGCVTRTKRLIAERVSEPFKVADLARAVGTSIGHLSRTFKSTTSKTLTEYVSENRIARAKTMLLEPDWRINEISSKAGFGSIQQFNRVFRKAMGMCPTEFRRRASQSE